MSTQVRRVDYFYTALEDQPGEAYRVLAQLAEMGVDLLAITSVPVGPQRTQMTLFPADSSKLQEIAKQAGMRLDGPHPALLAQGEDKLGAVADLHAKLGSAGVNVFASNGVTDGRGSFGYVLYVRPEQYDLATGTLGI